jgi:regulator of replication initiation timing
MLKVKDKDMRSDEDLRNLGNSIEALIEEVDKLKEHMRAMIRGATNFEPDRLLKVLSDVGDAANICKNSYSDYIAKRKSVSK